MPMFFFVWSDSTLEHLAEHGVEPEDFEEIVQYPEATGTTRRTNLPYAVGTAADGRRIMCIYEHEDSITIIPITAYEID